MYYNFILCKSGRKNLVPKKGTTLDLSVVVLISIFFILLSMKSVALFNVDDNINNVLVENKNGDLLDYESEDRIIILSEDFEGGLIPPTGWKHIVNNSNCSWEIGIHNCHDGMYSAQCLNDIQNNSQDEWIVTPILDFRDYSKVYLSFWWFLSYYWAVSPYDFYDLNGLLYGRKIIYHLLKIGIGTIPLLENLLIFHNITIKAIS